MSEEILGQKEVSLRDLQVSAILRMLFLNQNVANQDLEDTYNQSEIYWKILVLDTRSTGIISSVLRVNDLLKAGVTVHTLIQNDRASLPDVPAVYFIEPTKENLDTIVKDLKDDKYAEFYINFTSTLERDLLEYFAENVSMTGKSERVKQVFDQYLDFVVTEPELFSLQLPNTYSLLNNPKSSEESIGSLCYTIAKGLFNVIITTNSIPIIRAPKNGPAEMVEIGRAHV